MRWLALAVAFFSLPAAAQDVPQWFTPSLLDIREDITEAAREGRRLMLYFHQDGCPWCKQLAALMKIRYTPTLVFFDEKGALAARIDGYLPPERFIAALDAAIVARGGVDLTN
jgi:thioredoxin-related protein